MAIPVYTKACKISAAPGHYLYRKIILNFAHAGQDMCLAMQRLPNGTHSATLTLPGLAQGPPVKPDGPYPAASKSAQVKAGVFMKWWHVLDDAGGRSLALFAHPLRHDPGLPVGNKLPHLVATPQEVSQGLIDGTWVLGIAQMKKTDGYREI